MLRLLHVVIIMSLLEHLPEPERAFVRKQVEDGVFDDEWEAVTDAVRRSREEAECAAEIAALVAEAEASFARGEGIPYTPDFMEQVRQRAMEDYKNGKPIPDHVKP